MNQKKEPTFYKRLGEWMRGKMPFGLFTTDEPFKDGGVYVPHLDVQYGVFAANDEPTRGPARA